MKIKIKENLRDGEIIKIKSRKSIVIFLSF